MAESRDQKARCSIDDLVMAVEWCLEGYEPGPDEEGDPDSPSARLQRAAAWMQAEIARRREEALIRSITAGVKRDRGITPTREQVKTTLANIRAREAAGSPDA